MPFFIALRLRKHGHATAIVARRSVSHQACGQRKQGVVLAHADVLPRQDLCAPLANEDRASVDVASGERLHAEALPGRIAAVAAGTGALLVCQLKTPWSRRSSSRGCSSAIAGAPPASGAAPCFCPAGFRFSRL